MKVTHTLEVTALCPVDGRPDVYRCRVRSGRVIPVEDILAAAKELAGLKAFQEDLCQRLHRALACEVTLAGWHSGVRTVVVCGGLGPGEG